MGREGGTSENTNTLTLVPSTVAGGRVWLGGAVMLELLTARSIPTNGDDDTVGEGGLGLSADKRSRLRAGEGEWRPLGLLVALEGAWGGRGS